VALELALPAMATLAREAPRLCCELVEAEPEEALPRLALGDVDVVLGDEWQHQPLRLHKRVRREELFRDPVRLLLPAGHPAARRHGDAVPLSELAAEPWATGHPGMGWDEMTRRACREHGGFEPDVRHRTNDATVSVALVARGLAVTLLPALALPAEHPGVAFRAVRGAELSRSIYAATRAADAARPSVQALVAAVRTISITARG